MLIFMARKSKVEKSPHYNEILDMIKESISPRDISNYLKNEYNETISHTSINNFRKKIRSKTNQEYYKKKKSKNTPKIVNEKKAKDEKFDSVVAKGVSDLDALDNIITEANKLNLDISNIKPKYLENYCVNSETEIEKLKIQAKRLSIQAVNTKAKILKDTDGEDKEFVLRIVSDEDEGTEVEANKETES